MYILEAIKHFKAYANNMHTYINCDSIFNEIRKKIFFSKLMAVYKAPNVYLIE